MSIADSPNGVLYIFAALSLVPLGILAAGWASNNKWSLIGGMRAVAQQITYEVPLLLSALPVVLLARSMNLDRHRERPVGAVVRGPDVPRVRDVLDLRDSSS